MTSMTPRLSSTMKAVCVAALLLGCSPESPPESNPSDKSTTSDGLQFSGGIVHTALQRIELSAPIIPLMEVWQNRGGAGYPNTQEERVALVRDSAKTYAEFLPDCSRSDPSILLTSNLSQEQLKHNYDAMARCIYLQYGGKPYWIPQILNDVDVCHEKLGPGWRLPSSADIAAWSESDYHALASAYSATPAPDGFPVHFYFVLDVYARGVDGTLLRARFSPGQQHIGPLPISFDELRDLHVGSGEPIGVRCVRNR